MESQAIPETQDDLGPTLTEYRRAELVDAYEFRRRYPSLDTLETLIDDWLRADYMERSAYQIMTAMAGRTAVCPDDQLYAMIGAITSAPSGDLNDLALDPPDYFMQVCERKGDFSFMIQAQCAQVTGGRSRGCFLQ
jgi:hypothetical protein